METRAIITKRFVRLNGSSLITATDGEHTIRIEVSRDSKTTGYEDQQNAAISFALKYSKKYSRNWKLIGGYISDNKMVWISVHSDINIEYHFDTTSYKSVVTCRYNGRTRTIN